MVSVLLIVVVAFLVVVVRKNRQLSQLNRTLYDKNVKLMRADDERKAMKYNASSLAETEKDRLLESIQGVLGRSELICDPDFSLQQLSRLVGSNKTYVSQVINEKYGQTFSTLLGDCRVKEACRRIEDNRQYGNLTLESISESVGFRSRTTFTTAFKRLIGLTPSEYLKLSRESK